MTIINVLPDNRLPHTIRARTLDNGRAVFSTQEMQRRFARNRAATRDDVAMKIEIARFHGAAYTSERDAGGDLVIFLLNDGALRPPVLAATPTKDSEAAKLQNQVARDAADNDALRSTLTDIDRVNNEFWNRK